jgi:hypothetical protein
MKDTKNWVVKNTNGNVLLNGLNNISIPWGSQLSKPALILSIKKMTCCQPKNPIEMKRVRL